MSYRGASVVFSSPYIGVRACGVLLVHNRFVSSCLFTLASYKARGKVWRAQKKTRVARSATRE